MIITPNPTYATANRGRREGGGGGGGGGGSGGGSHHSGKSSPDYDVIEMGTIRAEINAQILGSAARHASENGNGADDVIISGGGNPFHDFSSPSGEQQENFTSFSVNPLSSLNNGGDNTEDPFRQQDIMPVSEIYDINFPKSSDFDDDKKS